MFAVIISLVISLSLTAAFWPFSSGKKSVVSGQEIAEEPTFVQAEHASVLRIVNPDAPKPHLFDTVSIPRFLTAVHRCYLNRSINASEYLYWISRFNSSLAPSRQDAMYEICSSSEFQASLGANDDAEFIALLYRRLFNRAPDENEAALASEALSIGAQRRDLIRELAYSDEIKDAFLFCVNRSGDDELWRVRLDAAALNEIPSYGPTEVATIKLPLGKIHPLTKVRFCDKEYRFAADYDRVYGAPNMPDGTQIGPEYQIRVTVQGSFKFSKVLLLKKEVVYFRSGNFRSGENTLVVLYDWYDRETGTVTLRATCDPRYVPDALKERAKAQASVKKDSDKNLLDKWFGLS